MFLLPKTKTMVLGGNASGKTVLLDRMLRGEFHDKLPQTVGVESHRFGSSEIWDTSGEERSSSLIAGYLSQTDCVVLTVSADNSQEDVVYLKRLLESCSSKEKFQDAIRNASKIMIVCTKEDKEKDKDYDENIEDLRKSLLEFAVDNSHIKIYKTSAKTGEGVDNLKTEIEALDYNALKKAELVAELKKRLSQLKELIESVRNGSTDDNTIGDEFTGDELDTVTGIDGGDFTDDEGGSLLGEIDDVDFEPQATGTFASLTHRIDVSLNQAEPSPRDLAQVLEKTKGQFEGLLDDSLRELEGVNKRSSWLQRVKRSLSDWWNGLLGNEDRLSQLALVQKTKKGFLKQKKENRQEPTSIRSQRVLS